MQTQNGALGFAITGDNLSLRAATDDSFRRITNLSNAAVRESTRMDSAFRLLSQAATGYFSFQALIGLPAQILKVRGEFQQLEIAFTSMLRSKSKADALLQDIVKYSAESPATLTEVATGAKQLLAYGSSASTVVKELRMLGDVAAGVSVPIGEIVYLYGTLRSQGRAYAQDIRQLAGRGIPIYSELATVLGTSVDKVNEFVTNGKVGFKEVEQAIKNMTTGQGLFAGLTEAQSKSLVGLQARLKDAFELMLNDIGKQNEGIAATFLNSATTAVQNYQQVIDVLKIVVATYGAYKAATLLVSVAEQGRLVFLETMAVQQGLAALSGQVLTTTQLRQAAAATLLGRAQAALNATMLANPFVLVATALAALVVGYSVFGQEVEKVKTAQEVMAQVGSEVAAKFGQQRSEVTTLIGVIKNQNVAESERQKAYEKLKSIAPEITHNLDFQAIKTADLTKATNEYLIALKQKIRLEASQGKLKELYEQDAKAAEELKTAQDNLNNSAKDTKPLVFGQGGVNGVAMISVAQGAKIQLDAAVEYKRKTEQALKDGEAAISAIYSGKSSKDAILANISGLERTMANLDKLSPAYKQAEESLLSYRKELKAITDAEKGKQAVQAKTVEQYDAEIKSLKELQAQQSSKAAFAGYQKQIDTLTKQRNRITGEMTSAEKKAAKEADKTGPFGSVAYWETIAKKAQEIIDKTPGTNTAKIAQQAAIKLDAEQKAEAIRKSYAVKTFGEELDEKRQQYTLFQQWVTAYGKESADLQFNELVKSGQSYVDYLNTQIAGLENEKANAGLSNSQTKNLGLLITERDQATGKKQAIDVFNESLQRTGAEAKSLTDYLEKLRAKQAELDPGDNSELAIKQRQAVAEQITLTERQREADLKSFLESTTGAEQQRLAVTAKYADLRAAVDKKYNTDRGDAYKKSLDAINQAEQNENRDINERAAQASNAFKALDNVVMARGREGLKIKLAELKAYLATADEATRQTETYRQRQKQYQEATDSLNTDTLNSIKAFASVTGDLGSALASVNGDLGKAGSLLAGIASNAGLLTVAFDETATATDQITAGISAAVSIINILTSSAEQRRKAEEDFYRSVTAQQLAYNLALNNQVGIQSELKENVFTKDYAGRIKDGVSKLTQAQASFNESLKKLQEGQAKVGVENVANLGNIGKSALAGAAIGTFLGPVGTVVGGIVGGLVGLFGGKTAQDEFTNLLQAYPGLIRQSKEGVTELNKELAQTLISQNLVDDATKLLLQDTIDWTEQIKAAQEQIKGVISELAGSLGNDLRESLVGAFEAGTDSAKAFGDSVSKVLENVLSQIIFNQVFSGQFKQLSDEMAASFGGGGDGSWVDDFGRFFGKADELTKLFNDGLASAQDAAKQYGLDVFKSTAGKANTNSLSGAIKGVTEETASVLAGTLNGIRITQAQNQVIMRDQLRYLSNIDRNTYPLAGKLDDILTTLKANPLRGSGIPG